MQRIINEGQRFSRRVDHATTTPATELQEEPYKLELIGLKGDSGRTPPRAPTPRSAAAS